jgi:hypothetical protein
LHDVDDLMSWPGGLGTELHREGARDAGTPRVGDPDVLDVASVNALTGSERRIERRRVMEGIECPRH